MKGGREFDAKVTAPLFPRLHVNDAADKGGPRAPPRNKMALYEQLSIPSSAHRFGPHAAAAAAAAVPVAPLPLPRHESSSGGTAGGGTVSPLGSQAQGCRHDRTVFPPNYLQQAAAAPKDDTHCRSSIANDANSLRASFTTPSPKSAAQMRSNALPSAEKDDLSAVRSACKNNLGNEDDFTVPDFVHSATSWPSGRGPPSVGRCSPTESQKEDAKPSCSRWDENQKVIGVPEEQLTGGMLTSKKRERDGTGQKPNVTMAAELPIVKDVTVGLEAQGNTGGEPSKMIPKSFSFLENGSSACAGHNRSKHGRPLMQSPAGGNCYMDACRMHNGINDTGEAGTIWPSGGKLPCDDDTPCTPTMDQNMEKNDEDSDQSVVDSEPGFDISPDDVVGIIGPKHFWKARRAIVNQQRVFAVQVFELHRLIKVQKFISTSPQLLIEGNPCFTRSRKVLSKNQQSVRNSEQTIKKDDSRKERHNERKAQTIRGSHPPPEISPRRQFGEIVQNGPHLGGNSSLFHMGSEGRPPGPWSFQPSGSQWLVPVMSPSEGLVYKPYVGPCPPTGAFMAPFFGGCGPFVPAPAMSDCVRPAYGFPSPLQQPSVGFLGNRAVASTHFPPPCGFPLVSPVVSPPAATEQVILPRGNSDEGSQSLSSDNMSNHHSEAASGRGSHGCQNELPTSTACSPNAMAREGAISPLAPEGSGATMHVRDGDAMPRVIKVVPHNRRAATETAARIFQFIQEERQHQ